MTYYAGWTLGWDTGYDQFGNGNNFIGGFTAQLNENVEVHLPLHGRRPRLARRRLLAQQRARLTLSKKWEYVFQTDLLTTDTNTQRHQRRPELWCRELLVLHHQRLLEVGYAC